MLLLSFLVVLSGALLVRRAFPFCWGRKHSAVVRPIGYFLCAVPFGWDLGDILVFLGAMVVTVLLVYGLYLIIFFCVCNVLYIVVTLFLHTHSSTTI